MIDFDTLCQDNDVEYENSSRKWRFRRLEDLSPAEARHVSVELKSMADDGVDDVDQYVHMLSMLSPDDCKATFDDVSTGLRIKEIRALVAELSKPTSLGE